ncbi:MAG: hypothetical protein ACTSRU_15000 [Candidatus Hodarchaeales archaeon]
MEFGTLICRFAQIKQVVIVQDILVKEIFDRDMITEVNFLSNIFPSVSQGSKITPGLYGPYPYQDWEFLVYPFQLADPENPDARAREKNLFLACMAFKKQDTWYLAAFDNRSKLERVLGLWLKSLLSYVESVGVSTEDSLKSHPLSPFIAPVIETIRKTTELQYFLNPDFYAVYLMARIYSSINDALMVTDEIAALKDGLFQHKTREEFITDLKFFLKKIESLFSESTMYVSIRRWMDIITYIFSQDSSEFDPAGYRDSFDYADFIASTNPFPLEEMMLGYLKKDLK